jgi:predicted transcriptional regulator
MKYKKGTFAIIPNIQLLHELPCEAQVIFMHLCFFSDENGTCYPSRQTLADRSNLNIKTIDKYLSLLIDKGIIKKKQRRLKSKEYTSNSYQILIKETTRGGGQDTLGRVCDTPRRERGGELTIPINYNTINSSKSVSKETDKVEFKNGKEIPPEKKTKKQIRLETPFDFKREFELLGDSHWVAHKIIYNYWKIKGYRFDNYKQFDSALKRELRPATTLIGYNSKEITKAMDYCQQNYKLWTLETIAKRISDLVNVRKD